MNIVAIIQARMGSTRLPQKMLLPLAGRPVIARVFERAGRASRVSKTMLATTTAAADDALADWAAEHDITCYRGSEHDVLDRYYQAATAAGAEIIVRLTGDCPLMDPAVIDRVIAVFQQGGCDYACNTQPPTFPDGLDAEVFSFAALEQAWQEANLPSEREHVTPYLWKHPEIFTIKNVTHQPDLSRQRWTLDTKEDYDFLKLVIEECVRQNIEGSMGQIIGILDSHPDWLQINQKYERNEGYAKSVKEDKHA